MGNVVAVIAVCAPIVLSIINAFIPKPNPQNDTVSEVQEHIQQEKLHREQLEREQKKREKQEHESRERWEREQREREQQERERWEREQREREQREREQRERERKKWEHEQKEREAQREHEEQMRQEDIRRQEEEAARQRAVEEEKAAKLKAKAEENEKRAKAEIENLRREAEEWERQMEQREKEQQEQAQLDREKRELKEKVRAEGIRRLKEEAVKLQAKAEEARREAKENARKASEENEKLRLEVEEQHRERERIQREVHEQYEKDQLERERIQHLANEQKRKDQAENERIQREAAEQQRKDQAEKEQIQYLANEQKRYDQAEKERLQQEAEQAKEGLSRGIQPIVWPTEKQFLAAKKRVQYDETLLHFAISGPSGSGKSSLINAFRGLRARDTGAAAVGTIETTLSVSRYPDLREEPPFPRFVWYDIPGAGTSKFPAWQYFNEQGLFIFDFIVLVYDMRFTQIDAEILKNCQRFGIPAFIVRSKANQHIRNIMENEEMDEGIDYEDVRDEYVRLTRANLESNLKEYGLWSDITKDIRLKRPRCYIVSNTSMCDLVKGIGKQKSKYIDEPALLTDILKTAHSRRYHVSASENGKTKKDIQQGIVSAVQSVLSISSRPR